METYQKIRRTLVHTGGIHWVWAWIPEAGEKALAGGFGRPWILVGGLWGGGGFSLELRERGLRPRHRGSGCRSPGERAEKEKLQSAWRLVAL